MKRTIAIHWIITFALGTAVGSNLSRAINSSSIVHGGFAVIATVALVLNIVCGPDTNEN